MLFAFFGLWETTLAVAAGAVSIPIIIHLLNRRRYQVVTWAAMRFLLAAQKQNTRRLRLEQLLLMALRCLLLLLIVLAMASVMPWAEEVWAYFWPEGAGFVSARAGRTHKVLVLDGSLSMALRGEGGKTAFERARDLARQIVLDSAPGDGFSVAVMKDSPVWVIAEPSQDGPRVAKEIDGLKQAHGNAGVPATLNMVAAKLSEAPGRFDSREVYFLTDLQQATWVPGGSAGEPGKTAKNARDKNVLQEIQKRARTIFVDVGRDVASNLTVTNLRLDNTLISTGALVTVSATVQNFGREPRQNVRVELLTGRARAKGDDQPLALRAVAARQETIRAGTSLEVGFAHHFSEPGTYAVQVRLRSENQEQADDLEPDDVRGVVVTVKDTVPVLLVNGKPAVEPFDRATEYLRFALNPFMSGPIPKFAPLRPKVVSVSQFADVSESNLAGYDCIVLCDVAQLGAAEVRRLETHLRRGGGVIIAAGDQMADQIELYNRLLYKDDKGILPAKLIGRQRAPAEHFFYLKAPDEDAFSVSPLQAFADGDDRLALGSPRFRQYLRATPAPDARARQILLFQPQGPADPKVKEDKTLPTKDPAIVEWNPPLPIAERAHPKDKTGPAEPTRYRGKVVLITSTLNMDWNTWPGSPSYGALMQELTRLAVSGRMHEQSFVVGSVLEEFLLTSGAELDTALAFPGEETFGHKARTHGTGDVTAFRWPETDLSGVYRMTVGQDPQEYLFAVNVPTTVPDQKASESDLTRADKNKLETAYPGWDFQIVNDPRLVQRTGAGQPAGDTEFIPTKIGPSIAHYALLAVLALLILEVVLAWAFGHWSAAPGATADPPRKGVLVPALIAGAAAVMFLVGGAVMVHAVATGDFLGFLPGFLRSGIETVMGIPPAPAGEGTRWSLDLQPYLSDARNDPWLAGGIALAAAALVFAVYRLEGPTTSMIYKLLLGSLRLFMILLTLAVLLPQAEVGWVRQGWPDVVILVDSSRSMGEPDHYQDERVQQAVNARADKIRKQLQEQLPERIKGLQAHLEEAKKAVSLKTGDSRGQLEVDQLAGRLQALQNLLAQIESPTWRPTRLQLAQSLLTGEEPDWLRTLLGRRRMKVHVYHLDPAGRAIKLADAQGQAGDVTDLTETQQLDRARKAIAEMDAEATESRLGTAVRQVLDYYRGSSLSAVIMLTDGVTTREETLAQVSEYAAQKGVPLFFVGIGDDHDVRDMKLHDLQVEDTVYVNDRVVFECRLTATGYKDVTVPVVLKVREKDGSERELERELVRVDAGGKSVRVRLRHQPTEAGEKLYIIQAEAPKAERGEKGPDSANLRLQRTIFVQESKTIKVLLVEGSARYEYRFLKNLLEREAPDRKQHRTVELKVLLVDSDEDFPKQDRSAIAEFPINKVELYQYDVIIFGDVDPHSPKLSDQKLRDLADFVRERGGGFLMIAGANFSPHAYKSTPLAEVLPIEPTEPPVEPDERTEGYRPELTPVGRLHPIFRFSPDEAENQDIWQRLAPMYWWSEGYKTKPLAEVLAVHPKQKAEKIHAGQDGRHPLVVQQFVGAGRSMFFGFDETWRWRFREDELRFNQFWIQTVRYLSRSRLSRTDLRLDKQTPYRQGEPIKVTVRFPDTSPLPGQGPDARPGPKTEVKVVVEHAPPPSPDGQPAEKEVQTLQLAKVEGSWGTFEGLLTRTREGKYRFWLSTPDVSKQQPNGQKPEAEAVVVLPPGELDRLRMNQQELKLAAEATEGRFYTVANAADLLDELPSGTPIVLNTPAPPFKLWNCWPVFLLVLGLLGAEWFLRKRKHLL